jgi:hypothetical protein
MRGALSLLVALCFLAAAVAAEQDASSPVVRLFDTGAALAAPLDAKALAACATVGSSDRAVEDTRLGKPAVARWTAVPEDKTDHAFRGDAVVLNDRLVLVVSAKGRGVEVYARADAGPVRRAVLAPLPDAAVSAVRVAENSPAAAALDATYQPPGGTPFTVRWRLTAGQPMVEATPGVGTPSLCVQSETRYVVVPDFFGDDMVFGPEATNLPRLGLPAENFFLSLVGKGDALLMCVWRPRDRLAEAILSGDGARRVISGSEVQWAKGQTTWVAVLEGPGLWHEQALPANLATELPIDWKPPFPAKWRADIARQDGFAVSWLLPTETAKDEGRLMVDKPSVIRFLAYQLLDSTRPKTLDLRVVAYPLDRSRETPLTAFCAMDVLRNSLGVGPCQYILEVEGLSSEGNPTPDAVMAWVEKQFQRGKEEQSADEIRARLDAMVAHAKQVDARIDRYASCMRDVTQDLGPDGPNATASADIRRLRDAGEAMKLVLKLRGSQASCAAKLADDVMALIGKENAAAECLRFASQIRSDGAKQDQALSRCRMLARWLVQQCRMWAAREPAAAERANAVRARVEKVLQGK